MKLFFLPEKLVLELTKIMCSYAPDQKTSSSTKKRFIHDNKYYEDYKEGSSIIN